MGNTGEGERGLGRWTGSGGGGGVFKTTQSACGTSLTFNTGLQMCLRDPPQNTFTQALQVTIKVLTGILK